MTGVACGARHDSEYVSDAKAIADIEVIDRRMAVAKCKQTYTVERIRRPIGGRAFN